MFKTLLFSLFLSFLVPVNTSFAQSTSTDLSQLQEQLISPWVATVEGEAKERALKIKSVTSKPEGGFVLDIIYGFIGENQGPLQADLNPQEQGVKILFVTQSKSRVEATLDTDGIFKGTFTDSKGVVKNLKMSKTSEEGLKLKSDAFLAEKMARPATDVPESCASFFGGWKATWSGVYGTQSLWVINIKADCKAKYSYKGSSSDDIPTTFKVVEIKQGKLSIPCGNPGGICVFESHDKELWANYSEPGSSNLGTTVFRKIN